MNQNIPNNQPQEIDLRQITQKIGKGFGNLGYFIFNCIQFFLKHGIALVLLVILGLGTGYYLTKVQNRYNHKIIVLPNFNSTEYLYSKVKLLNVKIHEHDTVFLKSIGIKEPNKLRQIEIEAIIDPYAFIENNEANMEMLKLIAEDGTMEKVLKEEMTSMKYRYHQILFTTRDAVTMDNMINPIMNFLNDSNYFNILQGKMIANLESKIAYNEQTLIQVNGILDNFSTGGKNYGTDSKLMYYNNENSQIDDILKTKNALISDLGYYKVELINNQRVIKDVSIIHNVQKETSIPLLLPTLFVGLYIFIIFFFKFYKKQKARKITELNV